jgi:hypothetical protein
MHTGLWRSSMYRHLVWENVDLAERIAIIPRTEKGQHVVVPLNTNARRALAVFRSRSDGTGRVVRNVLGKPLSYNADWFRPAARAAGIGNFRWHDSRRHYASALRQTGTPLGNIAELSGCKTLAMTRRYAHLSICQPSRRGFADSQLHQRRFPRVWRSLWSSSSCCVIGLQLRRRKGSGDLPGLQSRRFGSSRVEWWIRLPHASAKVSLIQLPL